MINQINKYIKICKKGILTKKKRYPLSNHPKISVIIPIYNGGKYLYYSLRSIQNQKMKNIEIIIIDDFSNDNSLNIIKAYMEEDLRIRLIKNKKNKKILYSKSIGALNSNGKYIIELDQDDMFIRDDCFDILFGEAEANNLDLVHIRDYSKKGFYFSYKTKVNDIKYHLIYPQETNYKTKPNLKDKLFAENNVYLLWGLLIKSKLYKKTIYKIWPIILNYQLIFHEDYTVSFLLVISAERYKYINKFGIFHLIHSFFASNNYLRNSEYYLSVFFFANLMNEYYLKNNPKDIFLLINYIYLFSNCIENGKKFFPNLFFRLVKIIINNNYLSKEYKKNFLFKIGINNEDYIYNSELNSKEFNSLNIFKNISFDILANKNIIEITIIIYCVEYKYLTNTIKSILNQKLINIEIIIIFDSVQKNELNYIKYFIRNNKIIKLLVNKKTKGIIYSISKGVLSSKGKYILFLQSSYIIIGEYILSKLYHSMNNYNLDILEFNLLINKNFNDKIDYSPINIYKCTHLKSDINIKYLKNNNLYADIDQEKELLINKLIKAHFFKSIIKKYNFIDYIDVVFNYYENIMIFALFKENIKFKHFNTIGIMENNNNIKELTLTKIKENSIQKRNDSIFYINFLIDNTENKFKVKAYALNEYYNLLSVIYNKYNIDSIDSIKLFEKFSSNKFIKDSDKINLKFYYKSMIN
jgi:glycosyltransferase involved in cell wall biosynthesis